MMDFCPSSQPNKHVNAGSAVGWVDKPSNSPLRYAGFPQSFNPACFRPKAALSPQPFVLTVIMTLKAGNETHSAVGWVDKPSNSPLRYAGFPQSFSPACSVGKIRGEHLTDYPLMIERRWIKLLDLNKKGNTGHE
jgi:hypothetical protein